MSGFRGGNRLIISKNELYQLIREEKVEDFNQRRSTTSKTDFSGLDFRGLDLRMLNAQNIDFSNCYFRGADLRGLNLRTCNLESASIHDALISGVYFPDQISPGEIEISFKYGTRIRYPEG